MAQLLSEISVRSDGSIRKVVIEPSEDPSLLPLAKFTDWQRTILAKDNSMYCLRKWGDPSLGKYVQDIGVSNFQAIGLYNESNYTIGGVSNYLRIPRSDLFWLSSILVEDEYLNKKQDWRMQKMSWLCQKKGTPYFYFHSFSDGSWITLPYMEWGTIGLGGNMVKVEEIKTMTIKIDGGKRTLPMARLKGFRKLDVGRPLKDLLAEGVVHRCTCTYLPDDKYGDTPKGIIYSPFWSPIDYVFIGPSQKQVSALWVPFEWLTRTI